MRASRLESVPPGGTEDATREARLPFGNESETKMRRSVVARAALIGVLALAVPVAFAQSAGAAEVDVPTGEVVPLYFAGFDVERAAENGYDVRTDEQGLQYAIPVGTAPGSLEGATPKFNPATGEVVGGDGAEASGTSDGDCGTAELTLKDNTKGYTAYHLNGAFGTATSHTWGVSLQSSIDIGNVRLDGLPPAPGISLDWGTKFEHSIQALRNTPLNAIAGGTVTTVLGTCYGGNPSDSILYS
jgi:hypothetical protein